MRKIKILFSLIILLCLIIIVNSNWAFFSAMYAFDINLYTPVFAWPVKLKKFAYHIPPTATGLYLLGSFIIGLLYAYFKNLVARFQNARQVKALQAENKLLTTKFADLKKETDFLQRNASKPAPSRTQANETSVAASEETKDVAPNNEETAVSEEA